MIREGDVVSGRYRIVAELGRGGMGLVHEALDRETGEQVALKRIKDRFNESDRRFREKWQEFKREIATSERLCSVPGIPRYRGAGEWHNTAYYVMDFVDGDTLDAACERNPRFKVQEVAAIGVGLATTLKAVHELKLVHRDVKPANIILGSNGEVHLVDLGITTPAGRRAVSTASRGYSPIEQTRSGVATPVVDVYGLGCTLIKAHLSVVPYGEDLQWNVGEIVYPVPERIQQRIAASLRSLLVSMVQRDAAQRPQSMAEVIERLTPLLPLPGSKPDPLAVQPDPTLKYRKLPHT